jgi:nuclear transport factor 2 (NTF2) superfamily protein
MSEEAPLHPLPPFTVATAHAKVKAAQNKWNTKDAAAVSLAYTPDSVWRNRDQFVVGREEIKEFLACKWRNEHNYRLRKEVFAFSGNKM